MQLDQVGRTLDPHFNPNAAIRRHVGEILTQRITRQFTTAKMYSSLLELKEFAGGLPLKISKVMDTLANPQLQLNVRPRDSELFLEGVQRTANRITAGLILAALIVGAALLMRVQTEFQIFGYPGLAMICFLFAAAGGLMLLFNIFFQDHRSKRKARQDT
jgi:hypothetical protein